MIDWNVLRKDHLSNTEMVYLNSASNGIISSENRQNQLDENEKFLANPGRYRLHFMAQTVPAIKRRIAEILNAKASQIALIQSFSIGINFLVASLPKKTKVLLIKNDYPSLLLPFEVNDFEICWFEFEEDKTIDLAKLESKIAEEKPEIVALSHCQWLSGYLADIEGIGAICKQHNSMFIVDATQSFGAVDIDVHKCNISVIAASGYKWALAGFGNGFIYISESTLQKYPPKTAGYGSYLWENGSPFYSPTIKSFEPGHLDHTAFHHLHFALGRILEIGTDSIHSKITELMDYLIVKLDENQITIEGDFLDENRLAIITIANHQNIFKHLINNNIEVQERDGNVRMGLHYYNNTSDIDVFINTVVDFYARS